MRTSHLLSARRSWAVLATAAATALLAVGAAPSAHAADPPLRDLAAAQGKVIGTAVTGSEPGNAMKWGSVEPTRGSFDWAEADQIVAFAQAHHQQVRGHTLVWHSQNPSWLTGGSWTPAQLSNGGSVTFGFHANWSGSNPVPAVAVG